MLEFAYFRKAKLFCFHLSEDRGGGILNALRHCYSKQPQYLERAEDI
jgi:hypothetical protein